MLSVLPQEEAQSLVVGLQGGDLIPGVESESSPTIFVIEKLLPRICQDRAAARFHFRTYLGQPTPTPRLTVDEWEEVLSQRGFDGPAITQAVVYLEALPHTALVWSFANRRQYASPNHSAEDLFGWGWVGLTQALRAYDPTTAAFSTYAARRIVGAMQDGVRKEHHLPKRLHQEFNAYFVERESFISTHGREPTEEELAMEVGVTVERIRDLVHFQDAKSLDEIREFSPEQVEFVDGADVEHEAMVEVESERLRRELQSLSPEERRVLWSLHVEERPLSQVAKELGLDLAATRRFRDSGLSALRERMAA